MSPVPRVGATLSAPVLGVGLEACYATGAIAPGGTSGAIPPGPPPILAPHAAACCSPGGGACCEEVTYGRVLALGSGTVVVLLLCGCGCFAVCDSGPCCWFAS